MALWLVAEATAALVVWDMKGTVLRPHGGSTNDRIYCDVTSHKSVSQNVKSWSSNKALDKDKKNQQKYL